MGDRPMEDLRMNGRYLFPNLVHRRILVHHKLQATGTAAAAGTIRTMKRHTRQNTAMPASVCG